MQSVRSSIELPLSTQKQLLQELVNEGKFTDFGKKHGFADIKTYDDFKKSIPIQTYESLKPFINQIMKGKQNVLWPSEIKWFAKSSGTTSDKSKFIPVSFESLEDCQFKGMRDLLSLYCHHNPDTKIFEGKSLMIGGSHEINKLNESSYTGDLSAVLMNNTPFWVNLLRTPKPHIALLPHWETKLEKMALATVNEDVTSISGVPTWTLLLMNRVMELKGAKTIKEVWPNLELYMHGGVGFDPYRAPFAKLDPTNSINFMETYNASEGFFGIQDIGVNDGSMLLMTDFGVFYEFMPMTEYGKENATVVGLNEVEVGKNYALIISTNAGLWRYMIGDTIMFTETKPFRFKITGRTKLFINAFGEELMIENAEKAMAEACRKTNALVADYTAAPIYLKSDQSGAHQWLIEFDRLPDDLDIFRLELDNMLKAVNSDYEAKRNGNLALEAPHINVCQRGTFYKWLKAKGKLGGQNKVPRLSNDRKIVEEILSINTP